MDAKSREVRSLATVSRNKWSADRASDVADHGLRRKRILALSTGERDARPRTCIEEPTFGQQRARLGLTAQEVDEVFLTGERLLALATFPERALKTTNAARHETSRPSEHGGLVVAFTFDEDHFYLVGIDRSVADGTLERSADSTGRCDDGNQR